MILNIWDRITQNGATHVERISKYFPSQSHIYSQRIFSAIVLFCPILPFFFLLIFFFKPCCFHTFPEIHISSCLQSFGSAKNSFLRNPCSWDLRPAQLVHTAVFRAVQELLAGQDLNVQVEWMKTMVPLEQAPLSTWDTEWHGGRWLIALQGWGTVQAA